MTREEPESNRRVLISRSRSMGSGRISVTPSKTLVHFGSPEGTKYSDPEVNEWLF